ncbi:MAG: sulfotransferase [Pseudorhodoplanes sp.]|nr:sulfotransferase [Pseudorhodoplanes sp.]
MNTRATPSGITVVCLIGTSRCGSTVLQAALAQFRDVAALGEIKRLRQLADAHAVCGCGEPIERCPIWRDEVAGFLPQHGSRFRMAVNALAAAVGAPLLGTEARAAQSLGRTLKDIARKIPSRVFVDSSKDPDQLLLYMTLPDVVVIPVHVVRDPRGVVQSAGRRTGIAPGAMAKHWRRLNGATLALRRIAPRLPWHAITYEDFYRDPAGACRAILRDAGHDGAMREQTAAQHTLGGSPGFSFAGTDSIHVEDAWRQTMPPDMQAAILRESGWPARHFGYRLQG